MIQVSGLKKIFRTGETETLALNIRSLQIRRGEFVAIMGPSGCGKSTLMNVLGLLDGFNEGAFLFSGIDISTLNERQCADIRKKNIGFVFQNFNLVEELTVYENIELPLLYLDTGVQERKDRIAAALERLNLGHRKNHFPQQLSGGQQQRAAIARAIVTRPGIILADEPTGNLDSRNGTDVMELLKELNEEGTGIVMVTHSQFDASYARRIVNMLDGEILGEHIKTDPDTILSNA